MFKVRKFQIFKKHETDFYFFILILVPAASSLDFGPMNQVAKMMKGLEEDETAFTFIKFLTR